MLKIKQLYKIFLLATMIFTIHFSANAQINPANNYRLNNWQYQPISTTQSKIVFEVDGTVQYKYFFLQNPNRLVIDFFNTRLGKINNINNSFIKAARGGVPQPYTARVVFELETPVKVESVKTNLNNVVFTVSHKAPIQTTKKSLIGYRDVNIVIDAGHGGKDPGAIGRNGTKEKDVVLAISQELKRLIEREPGMHASMTRTGNYYVTLRQRLKLARDQKADVFVAIHADAFIHARARGGSVYAVSPKGASSEAAKWLAEKENYSELGGVDLSDKNDMLRSVLIDLSQSATIRSSLELGHDVLSQLGYVSALHHPKVEQAPFMVLKSPDIPSILVETGFLSNNVEEQRLNDPVYQKLVAKAIMQGVKTYFYRTPPPGTWIAARTQQTMQG